MVSLEESVEDKIKKIQQDAEYEGRLQLAREITAELQKMAWERLIIIHERLQLPFSHIGEKLFYWPRNRKRVHQMYKDAKAWEANGKK